MAISFVGSKTFTHAAITAQACSLTDLKDTAGSDATLLEGDYVVINYVISTDNVNRTNAEMTPAGDWGAVVATDLYANDSNDCNQLVTSKFMGVVPDVTVLIPASNATTAGVSCCIHAFRGVDPTTPLDVTPTTATNTNTGVANAPSITPSSAGAWILACGGAGVAAGAVFTNPSGMSATTNHFRSATITSTTTDANSGTALKTDWASGAFDPAVFGGSTSTNTGSWCATTIALRPFVYPPIVVAPVTLAITGKAITNNDTTNVAVTGAVVANTGKAVAVSIVVRILITAALVASSGQALLVSTRTAITTAGITMAGKATQVLITTYSTVLSASLAYWGQAITVTQESGGGVLRFIRGLLLRLGLR